MLNKILSALVLVCIVCLTGCSNGSLQNNTSKTSGRESNLNTSSANNNGNTETKSSHKTYDPINTTNAGFNFSEDLAWVKYNDGQDYYGCIDNSGKCFLGVLLKIFQTLRYLKTDTAVWKKQM